MISVLKKQFNARVIRFLLVGFFNTLFHNTVYHFLMISNQNSSTLNNFFAFTLSLFVAYNGHRFITFKNPEGTKTASSFTKFCIGACLGLAIGSTASLLIVDYGGFHHYYFICFNISVLPIISYLLMKLWVFK